MALLNGGERSRGLPICPGVVGGHYRYPGGVEIPSRSLAVVRWASQMSGRGQKALLDVREWSGGPCKCPEEVGRPSWMFGSGREALPDVWQ